MQWINCRRSLLALALLLASPVMAGSPTAIFGVWAWRPGPMENESEAKELIDFCKLQGFNTVLLQMSFVHGAAPAQLEHQDGLRRLLKMATQAGVRIEALDGSSEMSLAEKRGDTLDRLNAVLAFQASQPEAERLSAIHLDIEPYTNPRWKEGSPQAREVGREMLETFALIKQRVRARFPELPLKFDIPAWFDTRMDLATDFAGQTKPLSEHIQDIADEVVIMSYRRNAAGPNSVEELGRNEIEYAAKIGKKTSLALETIELKEDQQISFFGVPAVQFRETVLSLFADLDKQPGFGGVYVHQYDRLKVYLQETEPLFPVAHE